MRLGGLITFMAFAAVTSPASAATHQVTVANTAFSPSELTITQGDSVTWNWTGPDTNHSTTTGAEGQTTWDSDPGNAFPNHPVGDKYSWGFPYEGEFPYFCKTHPGMAGKIIVVRKVNNPNPPAQDVVGPEFGTLAVQLKQRRIKFSLDEPARVEGKMRGPKRRTLKVSAKAGVNYMRLPKRLRKGRYGVNLRATDAAGNKSLVARAKFTIR
jgi:plastocyanin